MTDNIIQSLEQFEFQQDRDSFEDGRAVYDLAELYDLEIERAAVLHIARKYYMNPTTGIPSIPPEFFDPDPNADTPEQEEFAERCRLSFISCLLYELFLEDRVDFDPETGHWFVVNQGGPDAR